MVQLQLASYMCTLRDQQPSIFAHKAYKSQDSHPKVLGFLRF